MMSSGEMTCPFHHHMRRPVIHPESINQITASALHLFAPQPYNRGSCSIAQLPTSLETLATQLRSKYDAQIFYLYIYLSVETTRFLSQLPSWSPLPPCSAVGLTPLLGVARHGSLIRAGLWPLLLICSQISINHSVGARHQRSGVR